MTRYTELQTRSNRLYEVHKKALLKVVEIGLLFDQAMEDLSSASARHDEAVEDLIRHLEGRN